MRERLKEANSSNQQYNAETRVDMTNSLTLSEEEVKEKIDAGEAYVIRLKLPDDEDVDMPVKDIDETTAFVWQRHLKHKHKHEQPPIIKLRHLCD